jgi:cell wall-associated NlpC family hydrolase
VRLPARVRSLWLAAAVLGAVIAGMLPAAAFAAFGDHPLRRGARGHDVRVLQGWLSRLGAATPIDGAYGPMTVRAVRRFERRHGLRVDGRVSRGEARRLRVLVQAAVRAAQQRSADPDPAAAPAPAPHGATALSEDGRTAVAPPDAPPAVVAAVAAANALTRKPYVYGGGHGRWSDRGYDCSGSVSYVLHGAGLLDTTLDSTGLARWGSAGAGDWITVYGNATHAWMVIGGLRFDTSGAGESGPRWRPQERGEAGFAVRHPAGL